MNEYNGPEYSRVRHDFWERRDLSAVEKLILQWLHSRFGVDGQPWEVNTHQIAEALNLGRDATERALSKLKDKEWLTDNRGDLGLVRDKATGTISRDKSLVIESRRSEVIVPYVPSQARHNPPTTEYQESVRPGSNKGLSIDNPNTSESQWDEAIKRHKAKTSHRGDRNHCPPGETCKECEPLAS